MFITTFILFIIFGAILYGLGIAPGLAAGIIREKADFVEDYIRKNYDNTEMVLRNGIDVSQAVKAVDEMENMVLRIFDDDEFVDLIPVSIVKKRITFQFEELRTKTDTLIRFANENGKITTTSVIKSIEWEMNNLIKKIIFWCVVAAAVVLLIHLIRCIALAAEKPAER
jgi:hypothetical protein